MALAVWPDSPQPAGQTFTLNWGEHTTMFDSGAHHGTATWQKALYSDWRIPWKNIPQTKRDTILGFVNSMKSGATPFLMMHHKDFRVNSVLAASAGYVSGTSFFLYDTSSQMIRASTTTIGSLFSSLSGYVTLGAEYSYDQDTGIITANTINASDVWGVRSAQYYRKVYVKRSYQETGIIEGQYGATITLQEVA